MRKLIRAYPLGFVALLALLVLFFGSNIAAFYTDWLWYGEVGQQGVFGRIYGTRLLLFAVSAAASFLLVYVNLRLAARFSPPAAAPNVGYGKVDPRIMEALGTMRRALSVGLLLGAFFTSIVAGLSASGQWDSFLRFTHGVGFGERDAQFGRDIGFYVFTLPFLNYVQNWLLFMLLLTAAAVALVYFMEKGIDAAAERTFVAPHVTAHLSALLALALLAQAWSYYLDRFGLLFDSGLVSGAGYADVHARLPMLNLLMGVAVVAALAVLINIRVRSLALPGFALAAWLAASGLGMLIPGIVQFYTVRPNENVREAPYIRRAIDATRRAYGVHDVTVRDFPAEPNLTAQDLKANEATLDNIRLWDYEPLLEVYPQQQGLRQYYSFPDVDVDRYRLGENGRDYRQVWLAVREIDPDGLDARAQTWVNRHLRYTHGYGVVMSPAGQFTGEGLPTFFLKDVPPVSTVPGLQVTQPRIYYGIGMERGSYVVAGTKQAEFDFPDEEQGGGAERENRYDGKGGIPLSPLARFAFAARFGGWTTMMLNKDITPDSRLLYARRVPDRVKRIAPFLELDTDPYPVVADGRVIWIQDAYTTTDAYPYSAPHGKFNYVRNSVKAAVDAYDGTVTLYAADENDPILKTYRRIYPGLVQPASAMPETLRAHRRYPEDLFRIQRRILADYHVQDPNVFYTRGDSWEIARARTSVEGNETASGRLDETGEAGGTMAPYFVIMRLPGERGEEFLLLSPFTPRSKENMIALLAARCDEENYGQLMLYRFPATRIVYGPEQIGKRIRSDAKISPFLSLIDQKGSRVLFGSMLIVPVEKSLLYVQPLYVKAQTAGDETRASIPELKQVIVAFENRISMQPTLPAALAEIFGTGSAAAGGTASGGRPLAPGVTAPPAGTLPTVQALVEQAGAQYDRAQGALKQGDFEAYGREIKSLGETLRRLRESQSGSSGGGAR